MKPIFRYSTKDTYLVLYAIGVFLIPYAMAATDISAWWGIAGALQVLLIVNVQNSSLHHHTHCHIFLNSWANHIYELFISATTSIPNQVWRQSHALHHKHVNDIPGSNGRTRDPLSVYRISGTSEPTNFWVYCFYTIISEDIKYCWFVCPPAIKKIPDLRIRYYREWWMFKLYILSICLINWQYGIFLLLIYVIGFAVNNANNYGEHWGSGVKQNDTMRDSVGIYNSWYNWIGFNAGLHQEHHFKPGAHWSHLPNITTQLPSDRHIVKCGAHVANNPFWAHFKLLFKKNGK